MDGYMIKLNKAIKNELDKIDEMNENDGKLLQEID